jgi:hypothetical protein
MTEFFSKLISSINFFPFLQKHHKGILFFLTLSGLLLIFLPSNFFVFLYLEQFRQQFISIIGLITFFSCVCFFFILLYELFLKYYMQCFEIPRLINFLTPVEKEYLLKYINHHNQTATFSLFDGVVSGLIRKGILYKPDSLANSLGEQDFNINPVIYDYLIFHIKELEE